MKNYLSVLLLIVLVGCKKPQHSSVALEDSISCRIESVQIPSSDNALELKSYYVSSSLSTDSLKGIIAYNYRLHSLDLIELSAKRSISSIQLQKEGPNGISKRVSGIEFINKDSIWVYDGQDACLLDDKGIVKNRISLGNWEAVIIEANYAMNTAKFVYNKERHSLLYLAKRDSFVVEEYDVLNNKVINKYPLSYSTVNPEGKLVYADMDCPNVTFMEDNIIYNYPYESTIYVLNMYSGEQLTVKAKSRFTSNEAQQCTVNGYSAWERHRIENVHFYDVMYLPLSHVYVRIHLSGVDFDATKSVQTLLDSRSPYIMLFDQNFKMIGEKKLSDNRYSYFTAWCALPDALLLFNENSLSESVANDNLSVDLVYPENI